jgi:hypothetical protein
MQPGALGWREKDNGRLNYFCQNCEDGYYWNDVQNLCLACTVDNCFQCSALDQCDKCIDTYLVQPLENACTHWFENCLIPTTDQPIGLENTSISPTDDRLTWYCGVCSEGFYFDPNTNICTPCTVMDNCELCRSKDLCDRCGSNWIASGNTCSDPLFPNCKFLNSEDGHVCDTCNDFYGRSPEGYYCSDCTDYTPGCVHCAVDENGVAGECSECVINMVLRDGKCVWDSCTTIMTTDIDDNNLYTATCTLCADYYGLALAEGSCHLCDNPS